jgi:hypothetical protein
VQQPCSNPGEYLENLGKSWREECRVFAGVLQTLETSGKVQCFLDRKWPVVRIHYHPLTMNREVRRFEFCRAGYSFSLVCSGNAEEKRADTSTGSFHMWLTAPLTKAAIFVAPIN